MSFFWKLLFTTAVSGLTALIILCTGMVSGLLYAAKASDTAREAQLLERANGCLEKYLSDAESALNQVEKSSWMHELFLDHVLNDRELTGTQKLRLTNDLQLIIARYAEEFEPISFSFIKEPDTLYTSQGIYSNLDFYRQQYPENPLFYFPKFDASAAGLRSERINGQNVLVYYTSFSDVTNGFSKGNVMFTVNEPLLVKKLTTATEGQAVSFMLSNKEGQVIWQSDLEGQTVHSGEKLFTVTGPCGEYTVTLGLPKGVHSGTRNRILPGIILIILIVLVVFLIESFLLARKNYFPIKHLTERLVGEKKLETDEFKVIESSIDHLSEQHLKDVTALEQLREQTKNRIIQGLLTGSIRLEHSPLDHVNPNDIAFAPVFLVMASSGHISMPDSTGEAGYTENIISAVTERLKSPDQAEAYIYCADDEHFTILYNGESEEVLRKEAERFAEGAASLIAEMGGEASLFFGVGMPTTSPGDVYKSAEQAASALSFSEGSHDAGNIIFWSEISSKVSTGFYYPLSSETIFLRAVTECNAAAAIEILDDIIEVNRSYAAMPYKSLKALYDNLLSSITRCGQSVGIVQMAGQDISYANLSLSMIREDIAARIQLACAEIGKKRTERNNQSTEEIFDYINTNLYSPNLSLTGIADRFRKSPAYISTLFKDRYGMNYSDYVNQSRIVHASELLMNNEMSVEDACYAVGYISVSTFRRNFNKYARTNPSGMVQKKKS